VRADRLLSLLLLLQAHGHVPAPVLARRLEVSVRTVLRDVEALSAAGVPVYTARGRHGGVRLLDGYRVGAVPLTADEATSLAVGQRALAADLGLGDALDLAMEKIVGAGGRGVRAGVEHGRSRILVDAQQWMRSTEPVPLLPRIHDAVLRSRRLRLDYVDGEDRRREVEVDPLGLVAKAGVWYLVGLPLPGDMGEDPPQDRPGPTPPGWRLFRVARVRWCSITAQAAVLPPDADLLTTWTQLRARAEERRRDVHVTLAVTPADLPLVRRLLAGQIVPTASAVLGGTGAADSSLPVLEVSFASVDHAVASLLGFGTRVEVLAPPDVRTSVGNAARELAALYAEAPPAGAGS
jgi:predicted DNA-binding transcriptional regulator YafY